MARVNQISVSTEERFPIEISISPPRALRTFTVSVTLRAEYTEHDGGLLEQVARLQGAARRAVIREREQILLQIEQEVNEDYARTEKSGS